MSQSNWEIHGGVKYPRTPPSPHQQRRRVHSVDKKLEDEVFIFEGKEYITIREISLADALRIREDKKLSSAATTIQKYFRRFHVMTTLEFPVDMFIGSEHVPEVNPEDVAYFKHKFSIGEFVGQT